MTLNVAVAYDKAPFAFYNSLRNGSAAYSGFLVDLLGLLLTSAGLNSTDVNYYSPVDQSPGAEQTSGSWTGMTGELLSGRADIVLSQITAASTRTGIVDQSFAVLDASQALMTRTTTLRSDSAFTFLKPFTWHLWVAIFCTVFGVALAQLIISRLSPLGMFDLRSIKRMDYDEYNALKDPRIKKYVVQDLTRGFLLDAWMTATGQQTPPPGKTWSIRIVAIAYGLFSAVVIASYTAALAAYLTLQVNRYTVTDLAGLAASGGNFAVDINGPTEHLFDHPDPDLTAVLAPRAVPVTSAQEAVNGIRNGTFVGYIGQYTVLNTIANLQPCDMAVVDRGWGYSSQVMMYQLNSSLTLPLDLAIVQNRELGNLDQLLRGWQTDGCSGGSALQSQQLHIASFAGLWYALLLIFALACGVTGIERCCMWLGRRFPETRKRYQKAHLLLAGETSKHYNFEDRTFEEAS